MARRRLAAELRRLRDEDGRTLDDVARELMISTSKLSRLENSQGLPQLRDIRDLVRLYGADDDLAARMLAWAADGRRKPWWHRFEIDHSADGDYLDLERDATTVGGFVSRVVPSLFQTEEYSRAFYEAMADDLGSAEDQIKLQAERRELWWDRQPPASIDFVIDEFAVRRVIGGRGVMARQLAHLAGLVDDAGSGAIVRLLPFDTALAPDFAGGVMGGSFTLFTFERDAEPELAFAELTHKYFDDPKDVGRYLSWYAALRSRALSPAASASYIRGLVVDPLPDAKASPS